MLDAGYCYRRRDVDYGVCLSCLLVTTVNRAETDELIKIAMKSGLAWTQDTKYYTGTRIP